MGAVDDCFTDLSSFLDGLLSFSTICIILVSPFGGGGFLLCDLLAGGLGLEEVTMVLSSFLMEDVIGSSN